MANLTVTGCQRIQHQAWLTSVAEDNTKAKVKLCAKTFIVQHGEASVKKSRCREETHYFCDRNTEN